MTTGTATTNIQTLPNSTSTHSTSRLKSTGKLITGNFLPPLSVGVIALIVWEIAVRAMAIPELILPAPTTILGTFVTDFGLILSAAQVTLTAVIGGLLLGAAAAVLISLIVSQFSHLAKDAIVLVSVLSCAPVVALAPIFNAWLGATNIWSKIAVSAIMVFFPVMVNTTRGLLEISSIQDELMLALGATRQQRLRFVQFPGALPSLFDGLKVGSTLAVIGIIVAEYFGGPAEALGVLIANSAALAQFPLTWAAVVGASVIGLGVFGAVAGLERLLIPWNKTL